VRLSRTLNSPQEIESRLDRVSPTNFDFISQRPAAGRSIRKQPPVFGLFIPFSPDSAITKDFLPCKRMKHYVKLFVLFQWCFFSNLFLSAASSFPLADIPRHVFQATIRMNENETISRPAEWICIGGVRPQ
jgi:hypothetical protein